MPKHPIGGYFSAGASLISFEIRQDSCGKSPCPAKKSLAVGHSAIFQTAPNRLLQSRGNSTNFRGFALCALGACLYKPKHTPFQKIMRFDVLKIFDIRQHACKFLPCIRLKFACVSAHLGVCEQALEDAFNPSKHGLGGIIYPRGAVRKRRSR